jgi:hypothetical protein
MTRARAGVAAGVLALGLAAAGNGANVPSTTYADKAGGYTITIPKNWELVPRTVAGVKALAAKLEKKKSTADLGKYYLTLIATPQQRQELSIYRFQAFDWPASLSQPVPVEVSVGAVVDKNVVTAKRLPAIGAVYANALKSTQGSKVLGPKPVKLPVGPAELVEAVVPNGGGVSTGVDLLLIPRGKVLYLLSFQIEASQMASATLFTSIAQNFKFTN